MARQQNLLARCVAVVISVLGASVANRSYADAIVMTRAMQASTVAEFFIEKDLVRFEIEVGEADLAAFANALPDQIYESVTGQSRPLERRLVDFFANDWRVTADGEPLTGELAGITVAKRIVRDDITGEPLAVQPEGAEPIIRLRLAFRLDTTPRTLSVRPPTHEKVPAATIGFVCYHGGLPVNDFRYLPAEATLDLDWDDPWYSQFRHPNLRRQFNAPLSTYLYVEPYEVRKEIIVRPKDLQELIDLDLREDGILPVDQQEQIKRRVAEFLADKNPVEIDGQLASGRLDRIHFIRRTLRSTGIIDPPVDLDTVSATLGVIFVYPVESLPSQVAMTCELFTPRIQVIPAVASDEAGGLPSTVTRDDPVLLWKNYLTSPTDAKLIKVARPPSRHSLSVPLLTVFCGCVVAILFAVIRRQMRAQQPVARFTLLALITVVGVGSLPVARVSVPYPFAKAQTVSARETRDVIATLLHNVYRSFDHHDDSLIYDRLAKSISGELLADVYLETRESMEVKNQGGLRISVKEVSVTQLEPLHLADVDSTYRCRWRVSGWIGHWGHIHARENEHLATITIADRDGQWKITKMEMLDEQPARSPESREDLQQAGKQ